MSIAFCWLLIGMATIVQTRTLSKPACRMTAISYWKSTRKGNLLAVYSTARPGLRGPKVGDRFRLPL